VSTCFLFIFFLFAKPLTTETCGKAENAAPTGLKNTTTCFSANYSPRSHNNDTPSSEHNPISAPPPRPQEPTRLIVSTLPSYRALVVSIKKGQERNEKENTAAEGGKWGGRAPGAGNGAAAMLAGMSCCRCRRCHHCAFLLPSRSKPALSFSLCMQVCKLIKRNLIWLICFA